MSKNQEDNVTFTSEETTKAPDSKYAEILASWEKSRADFEQKSEIQIKDLGILELAQYFCADYSLIEKHQKYEQAVYDPSSNENQKDNARIYLQEHAKPDIGKFIALFAVLKTKTLELFEVCQIASGDQFVAWISTMKYGLNSLDQKALIASSSEIANYIESSVGQKVGPKVLYIFSGFQQLMDTPNHQESLKKIIEGTNLTEETVSYNISEQSQTLDSNIQVPTTGSSNLDGDDFV